MQLCMTVWQNLVTEYAVKADKKSTFSGVVRIYIGLSMAQCDQISPEKSDIPLIDFCAETFDRFHTVPKRKHKKNWVETIWRPSKKLIGFVKAFETEVEKDHCKNIWRKQLCINEMVCVLVE